MKKWFNSRTIVANGLVLLFGAALLAENIAGVDLGARSASGIDPEVAGGGVLFAIVNIVLRFRTSEPVG